MLSQKYKGQLTHSGNSNSSNRERCRQSMKSIQKSLTTGRRKSAAPGLPLLPTQQSSPSPPPPPAEQPQPSEHQKPGRLIQTMNRTVQKGFLKALREDVPEERGVAKHYLERTRRWQVWWCAECAVPRGGSRWGEMKARERARLEGTWH